MKLTSSIGVLTVVATDSSTAVPKSRQPICTHGPIDLSFSMIFYFLLVFLGNKHTQLLHGASPLVYLNSGPHNRFGFNPSPPIIPPGTEPDLQALNNPYIAAVCSQSNLQSPHTLGSQSLSNQVERDTNTNPTIPVINPALEAMSMPSSMYQSRKHYALKDNVEDDTDEGSEGNNSEGDMSSSESDTDIAETNIGQCSITHQGKSEISNNSLLIVQDPGSQSCNHAPRHTSLPSDHKFEYSRDKGDEAAECMV